MNKPHFKKLDRVLKSNGLYTLATNEQVPPWPTPQNPTGYSDAIYGLVGPPYDIAHADDVPTYVYDMLRLGTVFRCMQLSTKLSTISPKAILLKIRSSCTRISAHTSMDKTTMASTPPVMPYPSIESTQPYHSTQISLFEEMLTNLEYASAEIITENIRLSILDEKFSLDTHQGVRERLTHCS